MKRRWKELIFAVILGFIVPSLIFMAVDKLDTPNQETVSTSDASTNPSTALLISVLMDNGSVKDMELEHYITCVVLKEMPASFELEALKAQAVVARTYTLRRFEKGSKHEEADVCTNSACCQAFITPEDYINSGCTQEQLNKVSTAVADTAGEVLHYDGKLIEATYFSCSGGQTEDAKAVWGAEIPYLKATESPGEEKATHYVDTVTFTLEEFGERLGAELTGVPQNWIEEITYTQGGGIDTIYICGQAYKGTEMRKKLRLRSTAFAITVMGQSVTVTTKGYGHRVGMSQYGADAMAVSGKMYPEILSHYYQNVQLVTYTDN